MTKLLLVQLRLARFKSVFLKRVALVSLRE